MTRFCPLSGSRGIRPTGGERAVRHLRYREIHPKSPLCADFKKVMKDTVTGATLRTREVRENAV